MFLGEWEIDDLLTFPANTHDAATGAGTDADSVPSYRVYEDETGTAILNGSMAKLDDGNTVGFYTEQLTLSAANGFEVGKAYTIYIVATVDSVTGTMSHTFTIGNPATIQDFVDGVLDEANADHFDAGSIGLAISTGGTAAGLITTLATKVLKYFQLALRKDSAIATDNATEVSEINANEGSGAGAFANTTDGLEALRDNLATAAALATVNGFLDTEIAAILAAVDTEIAAIKAKTDSLTFTQAGHVDANVQRINDVAITGDGNGTPFGV